ncbi:uncharacterized protein LOC132637685 [Lycium barbarum]|uniref:uncharacterized protein LOC132637685 n=1 Tax=Lycium barbarum TaxID=112863 RepID=UPI00293F59B3|nr:uncharacterized protein LOC132637685 [Lycium barbarum]
MGQVVSSHSSSIKQIESQLSQISAQLNQRKKGTLPSDMIANLANDEHKYHAITTRSGKTSVQEELVTKKGLVDEAKIVEEPRVNEEEIEMKNKWATIEESIVIEHVPESDEVPEGEKVIDEVSKALKTIPKPPPPFPQRLAKKADDGKFLKFIEKLKQLSINIPFVEVLEQMPGYAKFMKDHVTKRRHSSFEIIGVTHHCSSIVTKVLVQKKEDPGAFTIPCTIAKALCDLGASINLMPLAIFNKLGLGTPNP